jgi:phosphoribosyl-AMP cyclohydrolase
MTQGSPWRLKNPAPCITKNLRKQRHIKTKMNDASPSWLTEAVFDANGLIPAIAQDANTGQILMVAWMNRAALLETAATGRAVYWSRSRRRLWRKGEESGHRQQVRELRLDCDGDVILLKVEQEGGIACHTGRATCFYRRLEGAAGSAAWAVTDPVLKDPGLIYK